MCRLSDSNKLYVGWRQAKMLSSQPKSNRHGCTLAKRTLSLVNLESRHHKQWYFLLQIVKIFDCDLSERTLYQKSANYLIFAFFQKMWRTDFFVCTDWVVDKFLSYSQITYTIKKKFRGTWARCAGLLHR